LYQTSPQIHYIFWVSIFSSIIFYFLGIKPLLKYIMFLCINPLLNY
jgi:hypothetical protein